MKLIPELMIGITTYFILQVAIHHLTLKDSKSFRYGYTNAGSTYIWCYGIILFLKRCNFDMLQKIESTFVRFIVQISFILITIELFLGVWGFIETLVLKWMPDATNYMVKELFGNHRVWNWPFAVLLWVISSYCAHYANNTDRIIAYYFHGQEEFDAATEDSAETETAAIVVSPRCRSKYTVTSVGEHPELLFVPLAN